MSTAEYLHAQEAPFRTVVLELDTFLRANPSFVCADVFGRATQLALDSVVSTKVARDAHAAAAKEQLERVGRDRLIVQFGSSGGPVTASDEFRVAVKSTFVFTRAYQDAMYAVLLELLTGGRASNTRIQAALKKPTNPVTVLLMATAPDYIEWFPTWRKLRNDIKEGTNFGVVGPAEDPSISFNTFTAGGGFLVSFADGAIVSLAHIGEALQASGRLARVALTTAQGRGELGAMTDAELAAWRKKHATGARTGAQSG